MNIRRRNLCFTIFQAKNPKKRILKSGSSTSLNCFLNQLSIKFQAHFSINVVISFSFDATFNKRPIYNPLFPFFAIMGIIVVVGVTTILAFDSIVPRNKPIPFILLDPPLKHNFSPPTKHTLRLNQIPRLFYIVQILMCVQIVERWSKAHRNFVLTVKLRLKNEADY